MANIYERLSGEFYWAKVYDPEETPAQFMRPGEKMKYAWKVQFRPDAESVMKIIDLQSKGVKNRLKKTEDGKQYLINFSRPTEVSRKRGPGTPLQAPLVYAADGKTPLTERIGNGSKGDLVLELYEHNTPGGGKAYAARLFSLTVTNLVVFEPKFKEEEKPSSGGWN